MLSYGLAEYPIGLVIHVLVGGYSYRAEVLEEMEKDVSVRVIDTDEIRVIAKRNTFSCSYQSR